MTSLINILKLLSQKRKKDFSDKFLFCISVISVLFCITDKIKLKNLPIFTILKVISSNGYILYIIQADIGLHSCSHSNACISQFFEYMVFSNITSKYLLDLEAFLR